MSKTNIFSKIQLVFPISLLETDHFRQAGRNAIFARSNRDSYPLA